MTLSAVPSGLFPYRHGDNGGDLILSSSHPTDPPQIQRRKEVEEETTGEGQSYEKEEEERPNILRGRGGTRRCSEPRRRQLYLGNISDDKPTPMRKGVVANQMYLAGRGAIIQAHTKRGRGIPIEIDIFHRQLV